MGEVLHLLVFKNQTDTAMAILKKWCDGLYSHQQTMRTPTRVTPALGTIHHFVLAYMISKNGICISLRLITNKLNIIRGQWLSRWWKIYTVEYYRVPKNYTMKVHIYWLGKIPTICCFTKKDGLMDNESSQFLLIKRENLCVLSHTHTQWFILGLEERGRFWHLSSFSFICFNKIFT